MSGMPTYGLDEEFPMMWASAKAVDDADRAGQHSLVGPLHREIEAAMRELWMARSSQDNTREPSDEETTRRGRAVDSFEGVGDFNSFDPFERYAAHQAAKGR